MWFRGGLISLTRDLNGLARDRMHQSTRLSILRRMVQSRRRGCVGLGRYGFSCSGYTQVAASAGREYDLDNGRYWRVFGTLS